MMSDYLNNQTHNANIDVHRVNKIYYAHSMEFYNTKTEKNDLQFLKTLRSLVVNPNSNKFNGERSMIPYLLAIEKCDAVWYRGNTIGVIFEVLTALALNKKVNSLTTKEPISKQEIQILTEKFAENRFFNSDISLFQSLFDSEAYENLILLFTGDLK